jgi:hypothetical protein
MLIRLLEYQLCYSVLRSFRQNHHDTRPVSGGELSPDDSDPASEAGSRWPKATSPPQELGVFDSNLYFKASSKELSENNTE